MGKKDKDVVVDIGGLKGDTFEGTIESVVVEEREVTYTDDEGVEQTSKRDYIHMELEVPFKDEGFWNLDLPVSDRSESAWGYWLKALKDDAGIEIEKLKDLEGLKLEFERRPIILASGFMAKKECPMPVADLS